MSDAKSTKSTDYVEFFTISINKRVLITVFVFGVILGAVGSFLALRSI
ncbi:hypothetical protein J2T56_001131 [Natronobacillus azotifigens]